MRPCLAVFILLFIAIFPVVAAENEDAISDNVNASMGSIAILTLTSSGNATEGNEFSIDINIKPVEPVYGLELKIIFDRSLLEGIRLEKGGFLGGSQIVNIINNESGEMIYAETKVGNITGSINKDIIARATFKAKKPGNTTIQLRDIKLVNNDEKLISNVGSNNINLSISRSPQNAGAAGFLSSLIVLFFSILLIKRAH